MFGKLASYAGILARAPSSSSKAKSAPEYFPRVVAASESGVKKSITEIRVFRIMNLDRPARPGDHG